MATHRNSTGRLLRPIARHRCRPPAELEELRVGLGANPGPAGEPGGCAGGGRAVPTSSAQIAAYAEHLDQTGAGHLAAALSHLRGWIGTCDERSIRSSTAPARAYYVRLLERLLTLCVVSRHYAAAIEAMEHAESLPDLNGAADGDDETDEE